MGQITLDAYTVEVSNTDRVLFPDDSITKGDLIDYYHRIATVMLPHLRERPLNMQRFPRGIAAAGFWQQDTPNYFPNGWKELLSRRKRAGW
jgi:bifunctional non-homologous end joining protein LigD